MDLTVSGLRRPAAAWYDLARALLTVLVTAALVSLLLEHGFPSPPVPVRMLHTVQWSAVGFFVLLRVAGLASAERRAAELREHWHDYLLLAAAAATVLVRIELPSRSLPAAGTIYLGTMQAFLGLRLGIKFLQLQLLAARARIHPARVMVLSFAAVILLGAVLLALPKASRAIVAGEGLYLAKHLLNCLFTATSAVCVTGLVVYDTGQDFTLFGQLVILALIQVGGLGVMIFGTVFGILAGRELSLRSSLVLQDALSHDTAGQIARIVRFIFFGTLILEAAGAVLLYDMWGPEVSPWPRRVYHSVFHSVSAFCNAGFALPGSNLVAYRRAWQVYGVIMPLIVLGGLGFPVLRDLYDHLRQTAGLLAKRVAGRRNLLRPRPRQRPPHWSLQSRIVLTGSGVLILLGAVALFLFETPTVVQARYQEPPGRSLRRPTTPNAMDTLAAGERALSAVFLSVSARTAGFNTVRMDEAVMSSGSHFVLCVLMVIGGSPGGTAGGAKTVPIAVLLFTVLSTLRRREQVEAFGRALRWPVIRMASVLVTAYGCALTVTTLLLCFTEAAGLRPVLFEACSALGTVGLSTGLTPHLTVPGRVVIILAMFAGRLGPLTLLVAIAGQVRAARYEYPSERLVLG